MHGTLAIIGRAPFGAAVRDGRDTVRRGVARSPRPLPLPAALLTIGVLSAGLWLGIVCLVGALF